ncbi:MAG: methionine--tRNA ligase [Sphingomonadales bacterium]
MKTPQRYLITAALPYANGLKHVGHLAGAYIPADIYVRYLRAQQREVVFVCGSDEHGTAIPIQAKKEGTTPQAIIDKYHQAIKEDFEHLSISFDIYHRTSAALHHQTATEFFDNLEKQGALETKETEQFFDEEAQSFLADRYIKGTCPACASDRAFGDQCETCGRSLSPEELLYPVSTLSGKPPIKKKTTHWYLPLNRHETFLQEWILKQHQKDWRPTVVGQCKGWIEGGLQPRAVTRDLDWGISLPDRIKDADGKVLYVWFDAPIGYISATKQWALDNGKDWTPFWQDKHTKLVHFIGKDNIVFHCIIFPVMLQLHGYILPDNVPANEFLNLEGDKMSTSRNWKLDMRDYINDFVLPANGGPPGVDMLRYYLTQIAPETKDSEFTWKGFQEAVNSELVAIFGNFVNRTWVLIHKLCQGKVPPFTALHQDAADEELLKAITKAPATIEALLEQYKFREALFEVIDLSRKGNQYMQKKEPWVLAKHRGQDATAQARIDNCLHLCLQLTANLAILINPFMPHTARTLLHQMKVVEKMLQWENAGKIDLLKTGYSLRAPQLLFRKIEDDEISAQLQKLKQHTMSTPHTDPSEQPPIAPAKATIQYDDFAKLALKTGVIREARKVDNADKLLCLQVDLGTEIRTIVSGIALHYAPESLIGQSVTVVTNLAPRKMKGIESNGMILMAEDATGKLVFIQPAQPIDPGSIVS